MGSMGKLYCKKCQIIALFWKMIESGFEKGHDMTSYGVWEADVGCILNIIRRRIHLEASRGQVWDPGFENSTNKNVRTEPWSLPCSPI